MSKLRRLSKKLNAKHPAVVHSAMGKGSASAPRRTPWVINGTDYGPAIAALNELAAWAFDLAHERVEDSPDDRKRVSRAQRYVLDKLRGKRPRRAPTDELDFTAGLLVRILDADLGLGMVEMVTIFDRLGLPTEVVPLMPRRQARSGLPHVPVALPLARPVGVGPALAPLAPITPLRPIKSMHPPEVGAPHEPAMVVVCGDCPHVLLRRAA